MNIRISADSTCDLSPELIEKYDIRITPLYIVRDGQSLVDGKDITPDEIYAHVNSGGGMCSTAAVSVYDYTQFFRRQLEECDAVVHFHISGDMSACYQNACIAAQEVGNVYPVDSRSLSTGIGQLVLEAAQLTREGKLTAQEIAHEMERRRELLDVSFLVERLDFLHKGGRCSGVALLGANMLNLRPCIQVKDGQMMVGKKYRGPYVSCLLQYIRERLKGRDDIDTRRIFITESGGFTPEELAQVEAAVRSYQPFDEVLHTLGRLHRLQSLRPPHAGHPLFPHQIIFLSSTPTGEPLRSPVGFFRKSCPEIFARQLSRRLLFLPA